MKSKLIYTIFFLAHSLFSYANTICYEPTEETNNFHLIWTGKRASPQVRSNVTGLCDRIIADIENRNRPDNKFHVYLWTDDASSSYLKEPIGCSNISIGENRSFTYSVHNISELIEEETQLSIYDFFVKKENFAPVSDILRVLALRKHGGCYMDINFSRKSRDLIKQLDQEKYPGKSYFVIDEGSHKPMNHWYQLEFLNGFIAAPKGHKILDALYDELTFKNSFFDEHRIFIEALYDHTNSTSIVMSLFGQHAFNDVYASILTSNAELYNEIKVLGFGLDLPYTGTNSWAKRKSIDQMHFFAAIYPLFHNPDFVGNDDFFQEIYSHDHKWPMDVITAYNTTDDNLPPILAYHRDSSDATRELLFYLVRYYRKHLQPDDRIKEFSSEYASLVNSWISGKSRREFVLTERDSIELCNNIFPDQEVSLPFYGHMSGIPMVINLAKANFLNLKVRDELYKETSALQEKNSYLGHQVTCQSEGVNNHYFFPVVEIPEIISQSMISDQKESIKIDSSTEEEIDNSPSMESVERALQRIIDGSDDPVYIDSALYDFTVHWPRAWHQKRNYGVLYDRMFISRKIESDNEKGIFTYEELGIAENPIAEIYWPGSIILERRFEKPQF